jgi:D-alanyl-D-alanine endopeptidase (penicillin-binding protein 7)
MKKMTKIGLAGIVSTLVFAVPAMAKTPAKPAAKPTVKAVAAKTSAKASDKTAAKATTKTAAKVDKSAKMQASSKKVVKGSAAEKTQKNQTKLASHIKNGQSIKVQKAVIKSDSVKPARSIVKVSYKPATVVVKPKEVERSTPVMPRVSASYGRQFGLNQAYDPVGLRASVALVVDQNSWTTLYEKNVQTALPIASITKLMTAMVTLDAGLDMNEYITITDEDAAHYRHSRLTAGTALTRHDVMLLALMSSENRAAYALGRTYPGGMGAFIQAMNAKAAMLNMYSAQFVDPSGLSPSNQASAMDLAKMVNAATQYKTIRELSTNDSAYVYTADGNYKKYVNSNRLITRNMGWDIGLQKTGTLSAAGKCLVLQTRINGTPKIMVFLDSRSADSRVTDAVKLKDWIESGGNSSLANSGFANGS